MLAEHPECKWCAQVFRKLVYVYVLRKPTSPERPRRFPAAMFGAYQQQSPLRRYTAAILGAHKQPFPALPSSHVRRLPAAITGAYSSHVRR